MSDLFNYLTTEHLWLWNTLRILFFFSLAWIINRIAHPLARPLARLGWIAQKGATIKPERKQTLQDLIASGIRALTLLVAFIASLSLFVDATNLVWMIGLFSAAFGVGARPLISDILTGVGFLFEDTFAVGEKVEIVGVEGVIEATNLRTTSMRAPTGELLIVPNGEIRTVRNFSRGRFSTTNVTLKINATDLPQALPLLEAIGIEAVSELPNLLEPWRVISEAGVIGQHTELTLLAKSRFGKAADMRPRLLSLVQERFDSAGIALVN
jgi:small conductance mechanosensitive channel